MLFSIIIPAFNAAQYLHECLASVSAQSFKDYEVIIVDDGSTDDTARIAETYAKEVRNATVIRQENKGPLLARRTALKSARGTYIVFLDSDDCLHSDALQRIGNTIEETNADIVSFRYSRHRDFLHSDTPSPLPAGLYANGKFDEALQHFCSGRSNELWGKAIRLSLFDVSFDYTAYSGMTFGEDLLQLLPVFNNAQSLCCLDDVLYFYRPNVCATTSSYKPSQLTDLRTVNRVFLGYAKKWGDSNYRDACAGEALQYINILKIAMTGDSYQEFARAFTDVRNAALDERCFRRWEKCKLRPDNKLLVLFLKHRLCALSLILLKTIDFIKKFTKEK